MVPSGWQARQAGTPEPHRRKKCAAKIKNHRRAGADNPLDRAAAPDEQDQIHREMQHASVDDR